MSVTYRREGAVGHLVLDRPPANSYDHVFVAAMDTALDAAAADTRATAVIVRSASERFFCAGADIAAFHASSVAENRALCQRAQQCFDRLARLPKLVLAELAGHTLGGGLELALACDVRLAADGEFQLGLPEVTLGVLPGTGGTQRLPRLIGRGRALDLLLTGRTVQPAAARALGIIDGLCAPGELAATVRARAEATAAVPPERIAQLRTALADG